jgi:selenocysteine lyase/cysteine desulfurase
MSHQNLEAYFAPFRENVVGHDLEFDTPYGRRKLVYADWTASGRLYGPIEDKIKRDFGPYLGNTHTETTITGASMTNAYHLAKDIIKRHVNADSHDAILMTGSGMTAAVCKLQRILGLRLCERWAPYTNIPAEMRPVIFITHMEHHSNQISWQETIADVEIIRCDEHGKSDLDHLRELIAKYPERTMKIAAVTACSNVTGIQPPVHEIARVMHTHGGLCFADYACSAPYVKIDMHPADPLEKLDAIYFSPHKFLGGPGSAGVLIFDSRLYTCKAPDHPGGGTVAWTNPWRGVGYYDDIELREDGGTPPFLQTIRAALSVRLKEDMGVDNIIAREHQILDRIFPALERIPGLHVLERDARDRMGVISFFLDSLHYNLAVRLLNDRFGIQTRGGCACAGTYGHFLFYIRKAVSQEITDRINHGDLSTKPGWVRLSIHPVMTDAEADYLCESLAETVRMGAKWSEDYDYHPTANEFVHKQGDEAMTRRVQDWFRF